MSRVRTMFDDQAGFKEVHGKFIKCRLACVHFANEDRVGDFLIVFKEHAEKIDGGLKL